MGTTQDLKDNAYVRVVGDQLSARTVLASSVVVMDEKTAAAEVASASPYQPNDRVENAGSVTRVVPRYGEIDVRTSGGNFVVLVRPDTTIRRYLYATDINDISEGDEITFAGTMGQDGSITADRIQVSSGSARASKGVRTIYLSAVSHADDIIEGVITVPPSSFDRSLAIETRFGERKVDVLKNAEVRIDGIGASVHDLSKGDNIRVYGTWDSSTMVANRIETAAASAVEVPVMPNLQLPLPLRRRVRRPTLRRPMTQPHLSRRIHRLRLLPRPRPAPRRRQDRIPSPAGSSISTIPTSI